MNIKAKRRKASPHKGTGRFFEYVRCPCCGKLARGPSVGSAGTHVLQKMVCTGSLGNRKGFAWDRLDPDQELLESLLEALERATAQVKKALWKIRFGPDLVATPLRGYRSLGQQRVWGEPLWEASASLNGNEEGNHAKIKVTTRTSIPVQTSAL